MISDPSPAEAAAIANHVNSHTHEGSTLVLGMNEPARVNQDEEFKRHINAM